MPEILIVGDEAARASLRDRVQGLGYRAELCPPSALNRRVHAKAPPSALVLCLADANPALVMAGLRRTRQGASIPVILFGRLGAEVKEVADVLDLGADHFLDEAARDDDLVEALEELAGPAVAPAERTGSVPPPTPAPAPERTEILDDASERSAPRDPVLGRLHRTLDRIDRRAHGGADDVEPELDLAADLPSEDAASVPVDPAHSQPGMTLAEVLGGGGADDRTASRPDPDGMTAPSLAPVVGPTRKLGRARDDVMEPAPAPPARAWIPTRRAGACFPLGVSGDLADLEPPRLLWALHEARATGCMEITSPEGAHKRWWLRDGVLLCARGDGPGDRLLDGLLRKGRLARGQYEAARRLASKQADRAGRILVESGFLKPTELAPLLRRHQQEVADEVFAWIEGRWTWSEAERCDERVLLDLPVAQLLWQGVQRRLSDAALVAALGASFCPLLRAPGPGGGEGIARALDLGPRPRAALGAFEGRRTLAELLDDPALAGGCVPALAYVLHVMGHLDLLPEPVPAPGRRDADVDRERVLERLADARDGDLFAVLGLPRTARGPEIRAARDDLLATFGEDALDPSVRAELAAEVEELRAAIAEAGDLLSDDALRSAYLAHLPQPGETGDT